MGLFLGSLSGSIDLCVCFDYNSFIIYFEIRKHDASRFVLLSQVYFGYLEYFVVHTNFRIVCSISMENVIGILISIALNV